MPHKSGSSIMKINTIIPKKRKKKKRISSIYDGNVFKCPRCSVNIQNVRVDLRDT